MNYTLYRVTIEPFYFLRVVNTLRLIQATTPNKILLCEIPNAGAGQIIATHPDKSAISVVVYSD